MSKFFRLLTIVACVILSITACKKNNVDPEKPGNGSVDGHDYVDLGLPSGIKWATCNVGASNPEDCGFYYAWGETNTKGTYSLENYLWFDQSTETFTKYTWENNDITLESADDAATANWGGCWRMPTRDELAELQSNCNWQWTAQNSINGWLVKGSNGNSIFLPASGYCRDNAVVYVGENGYYWSSSLAKTYYSFEQERSECAYSLAFDSGSFGGGSYARGCGRVIRPVYSGKASVSTTDVSEVSYYSATCGGYIASASSSVKARGVCWSTSQYPTINDAHTTDGTGNGSFTSEITGLTPSTKYFVRAYAINDVGTSYGSIMSFVTKTPTTPTVTTDTIMEYIAGGVVVAGSVTDDGGLDVTERGFCWSTESEPTIDDNKVSCGTGTGRYVKEITGLDTGRCYLKAFATNQNGISYGNEFIVEIGSGVIEGHPYIDLGLPSGTLWALHNVGAIFPEDCGNLYSWGETEPKSNYYWNTYKWCQGSSYTLTKYCTDNYYGTVDGKTELDPEDDVAYVKWGGSWHMPTYDEMRELVDECDMTYATNNGVKGVQFTGPNGKTMFLPNCKIESNYGYYWVNEICDYYSYEAKCTIFEHQWSLPSIEEYSRYCGCQVRPVSTPTK